MASIPQVSREMRRFFRAEAGPLGRRLGLRERTLRLYELAILLVMGWWHQPQAGPSALARFAGLMGLTMTKQEVDGPHLQAGRQHELRSVLHERQMPRGRCRAAVCGWPIWATGHSSGCTASASKACTCCCATSWGSCCGRASSAWTCWPCLATQTGSWLEVPVDVGASRVIKGARLLAERVSDEIAQQRQARAREYACKHSKPVNPLALELAYWTIVVTTVPATMLTAQQAFLLLRVRWQVELLFKLWKQFALLDEWTSTKPWRILCEVYAKLLAMVFQPWLLLLSCWDDPHRSLSGGAEVRREQVPLLVHGLVGHLPLQRALRLMVTSVRGGCSLPARSTRWSTSHRLARAGSPGLTGRL